MIHNSYIYLLKPMLAGNRWHEDIGTFVNVGGRDRALKLDAEGMGMAIANTQKYAEQFKYDQNLTKEENETLEDFLRGVLNLPLWLHGDDWERLCSYIPIEAKTSNVLELTPDYKPKPRTRKKKNLEDPAQ